MSDPHEIADLGDKNVRSLVPHRRSLIVPGCCTCILRQSLRGIYNFLCQITCIVYNVAHLARLSVDGESNPPINNLQSQDAAHAGINSLRAEEPIFKLIKFSLFLLGLT